MSKKIITTKIITAAVAIVLTMSSLLAYFFLRDISKNELAVFWKLAEPLHGRGIIEKNETSPAAQASQKSLSESEQLQEKLDVLVKELRAIDFAREVNDPQTPEIRREEIIKKMNLYASLVGQYSQMELKKFKAEENQ